MTSVLAVRAAQSNREAFFQPPEEVLRRTDSIDDEPERSLLVKTVQATLTTAVAFGAFAPHIATIADLAPHTTRDLMLPKEKLDR